MVNGEDRLALFDAYQEAQTAVACMENKVDQLTKTLKRLTSSVEAGSATPSGDGKILIPGGIVSGEIISDLSEAMSELSQAQSDLAISEGRAKRAGLIRPE